VSVTSLSATERQPELVGQTVVVIGGSSGIGLETARRARSEGANVVLAGRDPGRLQRAGSEVDALSTAAFDATNGNDLERFFQDLPNPIDHVMVTAGGPHYAALADMDFAKVRAELDVHLMLPLQVARQGLTGVRAGGTLVFMTGTEARSCS
jgi:NAD(P)-dependent dehydrogenase (short-subunit alcohol dehydrogenase family)